MPDLTVANELEFESWPKEQQELAMRVCREKLEKGYDEGYDEGYNVGYKAGLRQANGSDS